MSNTRRWREKCLSVVIAALLLPLAAAAQDNTKIVDPNTKFHRLYIVGNGDDSCEDESFQEDAAQLRGTLEQAGNQTADSTSQTLTRPTVNQFTQALTTIRNNVQAGEEVTIHFGGHGGSGTFPDGVEGNEPNGADEHLRLSAGNRITDDALAAQLGAFPADVTIMLLLDTCYGGGFTGGDSDLAENPNVKVVGVKNTCPIEPWEDLLKWWTYTLTDSLVDAVGDGAVSGDDVKTALTDDGFDLGPPDATTGKPKNGKVKCDDCTELPTVQVIRNSMATIVSGRFFAPDASVLVFQATTAQNIVILSETITDPGGSFPPLFVHPIEPPPYLIVAIDDQGFEDWHEVPVPIFEDGFESGDLATWSLRVP